MQGMELYIIGLFTGVLLIAFLIKKLDSLRRIMILRRAKKAEQDAIDLLEKNGYRLIATQQSEKIYTQVDGEIIENRVIADYIVKKQGKRYVVEVKTGKQVERVTAGHIRRQLLEYYLIFRPHGIILLDMDNKKLMEIVFQHLGHNYSRLKLTINQILLVAAALSLGFFLGYIFNLHR